MIHHIGSAQVSWGFRKRFPLAALGMLALLLGAAAALAADPQPGTGPWDLTLFHTNDSHSNFLPRPAVWRDDGRMVGGVIPLAWHLAQQRQGAAPDLLLDAGDFMTGNPVCSLTEDGVPGAAIARMMTALGYDAGLVGNHEFDIGRADVARLVLRFGFPLLGADIRAEDGGPEYDAAPLVFERGGLRVGVMGVSCARMTELVTPGRLGGLTMAPQVELVRAQAAALDPDTDLLVLLTHNGVDDDRELARQLAGAGVDVIVGGHSHTRLREPELVAGILIVQAGSNLTNLGRLDLEVEDDRVVRYHGQLIDLWADGAVADPALTELVAGYEAQVASQFGRRLGTLASDWRKGRGEHNLGNYVADCIRRRGNADVGLINSGSLRKTLNAGPVTALDIHEMLPFANTLVVAELSGGQVAAVVQRNADSQVSGRHGILQVSGLNYTFRAAADGQTAQVVDILVGGRPLADDRTYRVALPDYVATMADVYLGVALPPLEETGETLTQTVIEAVATDGVIDSRIEGRIVRLEAQD